MNPGTAVRSTQVCSVALKSDGTVWVWGTNRYGQMGQGIFDDQYYPTPTQVPCFTSRNDGRGACRGVSRVGAEIRRHGMKLG